MISKTHVVYFNCLFVFYCYFLTLCLLFFELSVVYSTCLIIAFTAYCFVFSAAPSAAEPTF